MSQQVTLSVSGAQGAELHLSGFFEPQREVEDEGMFMDGEEEEESEEEEEVAGPTSKKLNQSLKQAQANAKKNVMATAGDDSEDEDEDYDDEDLEDDEEEEDESEEEKPVAKKPQAAPAKPAAQQQAQQPKPAAQPQ